MKILVTGASGFIGRYLLRELAAEDHQVWATMRSDPGIALDDVKILRLDFADTNWSRHLPAAVDVVIHLAQSRHYASFPEHVRDIVDINVVATVALAEWARRAGARRFLLASSGTVYGNSDPVSLETDACRPETMYAASKRSAEVLLGPYSPHFEVVVMRLFGVYGPDQGRMIIPNIIDGIKKGSEITLASNIGLRFNPIFVQDCINAILKLSVAPLRSRYEIFNVAGAEVVTLAEVTALLEQMTGLRANKRIVPGVPTCLVGGVDKLRRELGFDSFISVRNGLEAVVAAARRAAPGERNGL